MGKKLIPSPKRESKSYFFYLSLATSTLSLRSEKRIGTGEQKGGTGSFTLFWNKEMDQERISFSILPPFLPLPSFFTIPNGTKASGLPCSNRQVEWPFLVHVSGSTWPMWKLQEQISTSKDKICHFSMSSTKQRPCFLHLQSNLNTYMQES